MRLHRKIMIGLVLGALSGILARTAFGDADWLVWIGDNVAKTVGQIFLRLLLMTVVPLVFTSIALGVAGIGNIGSVGRLGGLTLGYFLVSSTLAVLIGIGLVQIVQPGAGLDPALRESLMQTYASQAEGLKGTATTSGFGPDTIINLVPRNPVAAAANGDMLALIVAAIIVGAALLTIPKDKARPALEMLESIGAVVVRIVEMAMQLAPYGVFCLIFVVASRFGWDLLGQLAIYAAVVLVGLFLQATVVITGLVAVLGRMSPRRFWSRIGPTILTGFSTSSSSATLPTNLLVAERELGVPKRIAGFVLPLGATMNMNGTALYEGVTVLFLAQVFGVHLEVGQQVVVVMMSVITAIGAAGVPGGSLPLIMVVLASIGVPPEGIGIILGIDRILDMARTVPNVVGDLGAAVFVSRFATPEPEPVPVE